MMRSHVGLSIDDPYAYINRYPENRISKKGLPNGNLEDHFRRGHNNRCDIYFEIDKTTRRIVDWRYEGDCYLPL